MGRLDFSRISIYSVAFRRQKLFTAWLACSMLSPALAVHAQIACPPKPGTPACVTCGAEARAVCSELKSGSQTVYENCLNSCSAHCPRPAPGPPSSIVAPFDLTWKEVDLNGLPLNPRWALQDSPACPGLPSAIPQTSFFCAKPWASPCTTQETFEVPLPPLFNPAHPLNDLLCASSGVNGHHENWTVVTYSGAAQWEGHSPWGTDNDYNIVISRDDESAYTQDNTNGVLTEFDSEETINYFVTPWWKAFHAAVDHSDADAEYMLTLLGKPAYIVEVGMMGLDCAHDCGSEIHPTYALAVNVKNEPGDDEWAIFGRNWGDEGFCAVGQVEAPDLTTIYLSLPWYPGAAATAPVVTGSVWEKNGEPIQVTTFPQFSGSNYVRGGIGFVVELDLGDAAFGPLVYGELHLQWNMQGTSVGTARTEELAAKKSSPRGAVASESEPEQEFAKYLAGLPQDTQSKLKAALVHTHASPAWIDFHSTNLSEAPAGFQAHPPRYTAGTNGARMKIKIAPDPVKTNTVDKINSILREANAPKPPER
jgi:hypothetical protein